jgi:hypothetical protein
MLACSIQPRLIEGGVFLQVFSKFWEAVHIIVGRMVCGSERRRQNRIEQVKNTENCGGLNRKVVSVTKTGNRENVYDLQVKDYHNFAIEAGVFVHNSYLGYEETSATKSILSQEDIRFARTIMRLQRELKNGLKKIALVHLAILGIDPRVIDFDVDLTPPSAIAELANIEVNSARADLAEKMGALFPRYWIYSKIFGLTDEDIVRIVKLKNVENKMDKLSELDLDQMQVSGADNQEVKKEKGSEKKGESVENRLEKYLFESSKNSKDMSKKFEDNFSKIMDNDKKMAGKFNELHQLLRDLRGDK